MFCSHSLTHSIITYITVPHSSSSIPSLFTPPFTLIPRKIPHSPSLTHFHFPSYSLTRHSHTLIFIPFHLSSSLLLTIVTLFIPHIFNPSLFHSHPSHIPSFTFFRHSPPSPDTLIFIPFISSFLLTVIPLFISHSLNSSRCHSHPSQHSTHLPSITTTLIFLPLHLFFLTHCHPNFHLSLSHHPPYTPSFTFPHSPRSL